jgi:hypothetical protein
MVARASQHSCYKIQPTYISKVEVDEYCILSEG